MTNIKFNVSVGIPAYNEQENIGHLLNSILKQKEGNFDLKEIIVISDASNDGTGKIVRSFSDSRITLIENTVRVGQAQNQNKIIQKFSGDILLFLNADILLQNNYYIEKMIAPFYLNKNLGITSSRVVPLPAETFFEKIINFSVQIKEDMIYRINGGDNIYACHGRGRAFSGLLARQFEWNLTGAVSEDAYSYLKCKKLGFDFLYIREAVILYRSPNNLKDHMLQSIRFFKGQKEFEKDHLNKMSVEEHKIPTRIILTSTIKYFFKNPFFCLSYAIILIVARVKSQRGERAQARWIMSSSSKTLIIADTTLKICFFGTYDGNYSRNQILLKGLKMNGACVDEVHLGLNKENIDKDEHLSIFAMLKRIFRKLKFIPIILKNWNKIRSCDIIFVAHPPHLDIPFAYILAKIFRKPLVSDIQYALSTMFVDEFGLLPVYSIKSKALKLIDKLIFSLSDFNLFDTDLSRNFYQKMFRIPMEKTNVLPIGADNDIYQYSGINTNRNKLTVIYYGLYNPMHGVEHIVECARLLKEKDDIEFLMIGNGQTYLENKNRADEFGLKNMVFLSEVMEKDAKEYLDKGDIFLGFMNKSVGAENSVPNKVFQGLSMGKAVVTAETPIMIKVFKQKENIYLVKLGDANSLCAAILDLKNNLDLLNKIAKNGHEIYMTKFTPEAIGKSLIKIFNDILFNKSDKVKFNYNQPK